MMLSLTGPRGPVCLVVDVVARVLGAGGEPANPSSMSVAWTKRIALRSGMRDIA
ncbi:MULTISPECIES: hypothetical protein [unclassified Streptomyces]|uniref:hypothetical protein n=1 Tax=unclassified Streptomyces TaxID=2593676 RepID=UPI0015A212E3|nr:MULTISPECIES: hypothetical protein [unclassified Streptomyces]